MIIRTVVVQHFSDAIKECSVSAETKGVLIRNHMYCTICQIISGLTPCSYSVVYSWRITMDDHLSLESPAVDQLQVLLRPPAIIQKWKATLSDGITSSPVPLQLLTKNRRMGGTDSHMFNKWLLCRFCLWSNHHTIWTSISVFDFPNTSGG